MNLKNDKIYCHICREWIDAREDTYLDENIVRCLVCDCELGFRWDSPEIFG
jgi:hypothetical protein